MCTNAKALAIALVLALALSLLCNSLQYFTICYSVSCALCHSFQAHSDSDSCQRMLSHSILLSLFLYVFLPSFRLFIALLLFPTQSFCPMRSLNKMSSYDTRKLRSFIAFLFLLFYMPESLVPERSATFPLLVLIVSHHSHVILLLLCRRISNKSDHEIDK